MTKTEQERFNAAVIAKIKRIQQHDIHALTDETREMIAAARPLLEKEPREIYISQKNCEVLREAFRAARISPKGNDFDWAGEYVELTDTPYIVQKGKKPVKLEGGYVVLRMLPTRDQYMGGLFAGISTGFNEYINSLRVDCDE